MYWKRCDQKLAFRPCNYCRVIKWNCCAQYFMTTLAFKDWGPSIVSLVRIPKLVIQLHDMMNQHHDLLYKHSPRTDYFKHKALTSFHGILLETKLLFWESQALGNESWTGWSCPRNLLGFLFLLKPYFIEFIKFLVKIFIPFILLFKFILLRKLICQLFALHFSKSVGFFFFFTFVFLLLELVFTFIDFIQLTNVDWVPTIG